MLNAAELMDFSWGLIATWSGRMNGRWFCFHDFAALDQPIYRVSVPERHLEHVAGLKSVQALDLLDFRFAGLMPKDVPLVSARISTMNIYSANLESK